MEQNNNNEQNAFDTETHYGKQRAAELRAGTKYFSKLSSYENFILSQGWRYPTEKELNAAYERLQRVLKDILLSEEEFLIETRIKGKEKIENAKRAYAILVGMIEKKQITAREIYYYTDCTDCIQSPETIIAYPCAPNEWLVNTCGTKTSKDSALVYVCQEFGFEVCRVQLIGTHYYDASDSNFIRFDCGGYGWLAKDGELYKLYI